MTMTRTVDGEIGELLGPVGDGWHNRVGVWRPSLSDAMLAALCNDILAGVPGNNAIAKRYAVRPDTVTRIIRALHRLLLRKRGVALKCQCGKERLYHGGPCKIENDYGPAPPDAKIRTLPGDPPRRFIPPKPPRVPTDMVADSGAPLFRHLRGVRGVCPECHAVESHYSNCPSLFRVIHQVVAGY